jgi:DNA-directed RNA polymerase subunit RPC12/RpoP
MRTMNRLRGGRMQAREGGRWARNDLEKDMGIAVEVCPQCRRLNPRDAHQAPAFRCHACGHPLFPPCPEHGEAQCLLNCHARPCASCGQDQTVRVPPFVDPLAWNRGELCKQCGRVLPGVPR